MLPGHQVCQKRQVEIITFASGTKRGLPVFRAFLPFHLRKIFDGVERRKFGFPCSFKLNVTNAGRFVLFGFLRADSYRNGDRRLNVKDVFVLARAASFAANIKNPYLVTLPTHMFAHSAKSFSFQIRGDFS